MLLPEEKFDGEIREEAQSDCWRAYPQTRGLVIPRNVGLFARFREDTQLFLRDRMSFLSIRE